MPQVGIRKLKNDASEIIRAVREEQAEYIVTYHGQPVAVILPVVETPIAVAAGPTPELRAALAALRTRIAAQWSSDKTAVELVEEQRR
jgi:prevent-host-death family protein